MERWRLDTEQMKGCRTSQAKAGRHDICNEWENTYVVKYFIRAQESTSNTPKFLSKVCSVCIIRITLRVHLLFDTIYSLAVVVKSPLIKFQLKNQL